MTDSTRPSADSDSEQFAPNHKVCYRCQGSGRERGVFYGADPGDCRDCGGKGVVFKPTPPTREQPPAGVEAAEQVAECDHGECFGGKCIHKAGQSAASVPSDAANSHQEKCPRCGLPKDECDAQKNFPDPEAL